MSGFIVESEIQETVSRHHFWLKSVASKSGHKPLIDEVGNQPKGAYVIEQYEPVGLPDTRERATIMSRQLSVAPLINALMSKSKSTFLNSWDLNAATMFEQINVSEVANRRSDRGNHAWLSASAGWDSRVGTTPMNFQPIPEASKESEKRYRLVEDQNGLGFGDRAGLEAQHIWQACDRIPVEDPLLNEGSKCGMDKKVWM